MIKLTLLINWNGLKAADWLAEQNLVDVHVFGLANGKSHRPRKRIGQDGLLLRAEGVGIIGDVLAMLLDDSIGPPPETYWNQRL